VKKVCSSKLGGENAACLLAFRWLAHVKASLAEPRYRKCSNYRKVKVIYVELLHQEPVHYTLGFSVVHVCTKVTEKSLYWQYLPLILILTLIKWQRALREQS
jgi:hypothetical protein